MIIGGGKAIASEPPSAETSVLEEIQRYSQDSAGDNSMQQVTSVSQLRDVSPSDWAYEALRNLVNRYNCIEGYPDRTFRGNRALTRYEFAAGLNSCLQTIERLIAASTADFVTRNDLTTLERLIQEFEGELATLGTQVDALEGRVGFLEENQFSTTTTLTGEVVLGVAGIATGDDAFGNEIDSNTVLGHRTRLELNTSFTGNDFLYTRLATGNFPDFTDVTNTAEGALAFSQPDDNDVALEVLLYGFPLTDNTDIVVAAHGGAADDFADTLNLLDGDGATGALSAFGTRNPIYYQLDDGAGAGLIHQFGDLFEVSLAYLSQEASDPSLGNGLFNGSYGALAQLVFEPTERLNIGLTYIHTYNQPSTGTGSRAANFNDFFFDLDPLATSNNSYGIQASWALSERFVLGGWAGYTTTQTLTPVSGDRGTVDIWNWAVTLALPDLGKEGNLAGLIVGMEPKVFESNVTGIPEDEDTSLHIEAFYQYALTDNIAITPGVIWLTAPNHNHNNNDLVALYLRLYQAF
ncbi:MAG: iron uptake porin [Chroococcales cyanobacterium]